MKQKIAVMMMTALFALTGATMAQNVPSYLPTNGLKGWWPFNGNANDESGNGNNGTVNGAALTADRFGNGNKAYSFDGVDDFIDFGLVPSSAPTSSSTNTISFWIKNINYGNALSKYNNLDPSNSNFVFSLNSADELLIMSGNGTNWISTTSASFSNWKHVVGVYNSNNGQSQLFINGILVATGAININSNISTSKLLAGKVDGSPPNHFTGFLDDIGIWNRALTAQEISGIYNGNICYQNITVTDTLLINLGISGFNPVTYNNTIKIYPNPTKDHITIDYGNYATLGGYKLKIVNSLGQQMFQANISQQLSYISLNSWTGNGIYFVYIIDPQGNTIDVKKIVIQ